MAALIIRTGKHQGKRLGLPEGDFVIGRDPSCQVRLATDEVSREHCRVRCEGEDVYVTDLNSRNGTFVNDRAISGEIMLRPGDTLRVGPVTFQLSSKKPAAKVPESNAASNRPSDESIADWLSDDTSQPTADSDSSEIDTNVVAKSANITDTAAADEDSALTPLPFQKKSLSIGEEGESIIQRHFELVQSGKLPKRTPALKPR